MKNQEVLEAKSSGIEDLEVQEQESLLTAMKSQNPESSKDATTLRQVQTTGLPKSCINLRSMGHVNNGIYLIMGANSIDTVFCDFTQAQSSSSKSINFQMNIQIILVRVPYFLN